MQDRIDRDRRGFIATMATATLAAAASSACSGQPTGARSLRFASLAEAAVELDQLAQAPALASTTDWSWAQTLVHCAQSIEYSMIGYPSGKSALFQRTVGTAAYGWGPLEIPTGGSLAAGTAAQRLLVVVGYLFVSQLVTAGLAFWLSTRTDAPLGAVGGAVGLTIVGNVLDAVTALGDWRDFLPAHWQFAWADAIQPRPEWGGMIQGTAVSVTYALILFALAFRGFARKDVVS
jgi:hypothetical protein